MARFRSSKSRSPSKRTSQKKASATPLSPHNRDEDPASESPKKESGPSSHSFNDVVQSKEKASSSAEGNNVPEQLSQEKPPRSSPRNSDERSKKRREKRKKKSLAVLTAIASPEEDGSKASAAESAKAEFKGDISIKSGKKKSKSSWFRKRKDGRDDRSAGPFSVFSSGTKSNSTPLVTIEQPRQTLRETTPLQQQLWIGACQQAIAAAGLDGTEDTGSCDSPIFEEPLEAAVAASGYYMQTQNQGVYVDYSTFDDGDSISSLDLLFKWLTCRDLTKDDRKVDHSGKVIGVGSAENVGALSFDAEARTHRRTFISR